MSFNDIFITLQGFKENYNKKYNYITISDIPHFTLKE